MFFTNSDLFHCSSGDVFIALGLWPSGATAASSGRYALPVELLRAAPKEAPRTLRHPRAPACTGKSNIINYFY